MRYEVWAPRAGRVEVATGAARYPMRPAGAHGWWAGEAPEGDYGFVLDGEGPVPDPRSPWQPDGVHGLGRAYDHGRFAWTDRGWRGKPLAGSVLYELHVGTFTPEGTFDGAVARLDHLVRLGVDAVELMPVAAFPGTHGWGYDGVHLWAVHEPYGGPDGLKRLVDGCHARGLAVILDVVYNHLGPSGNYLDRYGPYFTDVYATPWGPSVAFDRPGSDEVRAFVVENALMWLRDYHLDGLRLDAVHAIQDRRALHILEELGGAVRRLSAHLGRELVVIAESDLNDPRLITPVEAGGYGLDAQWSDDFHHALHAALTGERQGYYADFGTLRALAKTLTGGYFHDGGWSGFRGRSHGRKVDTTRTPGHRFLGYLQNHDQVGNRAAGDRMPPELLWAGAALLLTAPFTPMLFMGEEWGAGTPFRYFTDHVDAEVARAVSDGRRTEFAEHGWAAGDVPDPQDPGTYRRSILDWTEPDRPAHRDLLTWYRDLIALRRARPELTDGSLIDVRVDYDEDARWIVLHRGPLRTAANLGSGPVRLPVPAGDLLLASAPGARLCGGVLELPARAAALVDAGDRGAGVR